MTLFRKKSAPVKAYQYTQAGDNYRPDWFQDRVTSNVIVTYPEHFIVCPMPGSNQRLRGDLGDWCILDANGAVYPVKSERFAAIYEPVEDAQT